jgi:hypothetical protein
MDSTEARVTVAVRVRPQLAFAANALQQSERYEEVICIPTSDTTLRLAERRAAKLNRNMSFAYDHVFDVDATQVDVYEAAALDAVDSVLGGTNASLLTYGQTGSGKTFTVLGKTAQGSVGDGSPDKVVGPDSGLLLRAIQDMLLFAEAVQRKQERYVVLGLTAIEIYNDEIRDLLCEGGRGPAAPLQPIMTKDALHLPGLTHMPLRTLTDACAVYERATARRVQRATSANDTSSRSHAIFTVVVFQAPMSPPYPCAPTLAECCAARDAQMSASARSARSPSLSPSPPRNDFFDGAPCVLQGAQGVPMMHSVLTVADLAGSEKARHADVHGAGFDELRRINASLTALGNVVHHLYHGSAHVPYRDSKLTMVLRDTFAAPRARVVLFVNVSPTVLTCEETLSSLYFADKMKGMTVPNTAATPQQAALQTSYLKSLRLHDTLLAEMRIFHVQQELSPGGLLQRATSTAFADDSGELSSPLLQLPFYTALTDDREKARRMQRLCAQLKEVAGAESCEARLQRLADTARREVRKTLLKEYSQRRAAAHANVAKAEQSNALLRQELAETEAAMCQSLSQAKAAAQAMMVVRQELRRAKAALCDGHRDNTNNADNQGTCNNDSAGVPDELGDFTEEVAIPISPTEQTLRSALEVAALRHTLLELVAFNVRTDLAPTTPGTDHDSSEGGLPPRAAKSRSRSGTATSTRHHSRTHATVKDWVRGAVLAMANNAVVQSTRRSAKSQERPPPPPSLQSSRTPFGDVTNGQPSQRKTQQLPKYWKVIQQGNGASQCREGEAAAQRVQVARGSHSSFDDPSLLTRVTAYMDMGASLLKLDRNGHPQSRWFYLAQREDRLMLCWDESRHGAGFSGGGHVYLDAVEKIVLGRSSPGFLQHAKVSSAGAAAVSARVQKAAAEEGLCNSFTVVYRSRSNHRDFKFVDIICPSTKELETWVVGLAHWAGVSPFFEDTRQPAGDGAVAGSAAVDEDGGKRAVTGEATFAAADLRPQEAALCRAWHIPADVLRKTTQEMDTRRARHHSGTLRLTPGELRDLTGLDIFRASALWLHCAKAGLVTNPTKTLCCFVGTDKPGEAASERAAVA